MPDLHVVGLISDSSLMPWLYYANKISSQIPIGDFTYEPKPCQMLLAPSGDPVPYLYSSPDGLQLYIAPTNSCLSVCGERGAFNDPRRPTNLLTCGLFASLADIWQRLSYQPCPWDGLQETSKELRKDAEEKAADAEKALVKFSPLGLDYRNTSYVERVKHEVSWCLSGLTLDLDLKTTSLWSYLGICGVQSIFSDDYSSSGLREEGLASCINAVCKPKTFDPDLGGIGVSKHWPATAI